MFSCVVATPPPAAASLFRLQVPVHQWGGVGQGGGGWSQQQEQDNGVEVVERSVGSAEDDGWPGVEHGLLCVRPARAAAGALMSQQAAAGRTTRFTNSIYFTNDLDFRTNNVKNVDHRRVKMLCFLPAITTQEGVREGGRGKC